MEFLRAALAAAFALTSFGAAAADYPAPKQGDWIARDFRFHTGETLPELKQHYVTLGDPKNPAADFYFVESSNPHPPSITGNCDSESRAFQRSSIVRVQMGC